MNAPRIALLVAALVFAAQADLFAQQVPPVAPGDRVRVTAPTIDPDPLVGTLVALGADTCVLEVEGRAELWALPLASVETLEVRKLAMFRPLHILIGAGAGLVVGGIMAANIIREEAPFAEERATERLVFGPLIGAAVGAAIPGMRWKRVGLEEFRAQLGVRVDGAPSLSLSMSVAVQ